MSGWVPAGNNTSSYLQMSCCNYRLELVFAEERKRASERIIAMTKDHEQKMKQVILAMDLGS